MKSFTNKKSNSIRGDSKGFFVFFGAQANRENGNDKNESDKERNDERWWEGSSSSFRVALRLVAAEGVGELRSAEGIDCKVAWPPD